MRKVTILLRWLKLLDYLFTNLPSHDHQWTCTYIKQVRSSRMEVWVCRRKKWPSGSKRHNSSEKKSYGLTGSSKKIQSDAISALRFIIGREIVVSGEEYQIYVWSVSISPKWFSSGTGVDGSNARKSEPQTSIRIIFQAMLVRLKISVTVMFLFEPLSVILWVTWNTVSQICWHSPPQPLVDENQ